MLYKMVHDEKGVLREVRDFEIEAVGNDAESPLLEAFVVGYTGDTTHASLIFHKIQLAGRMKATIARQIST